MQQVAVIAVGKASGFFAEGIAEYTGRLSRFCRFEQVVLAEERIDEKSAGNAAVQAALGREGRRILAAVPQNAVLAALCVEGQAATTEQLFSFLERAAQSAKPAVVFAVGSSHGLSDEVKKAAAWKLSISGMTLPHQMARLVLCEQIYRALNIRAGTKYHK